MVEFKEISSEEAQKLNSELRLSFWAIPIVLSIALLLVTLILNWLFDAPWSIFWYGSGGLFAIFVVARMINGKPPELMEGIMKVVRRAKVVDVAYKGNRSGLGNLNLDQRLLITLAPEPTPSGYLEHHTFTAYQTLGMTYYNQDGSLKGRRAHLIDREVEIEYLAESGTVLAFRELNPASNPPTLYLRWGNIQLSRNMTILNQKRVDFIYLSKDIYGNAGVFLRSDSLRDELFVPLYAKNIERLENWLFSLEDFDKNQYLKLRATPSDEEILLWERRIKQGVSYQSVYAGERVSLVLKSIYVYRYNSYNQSIKTKGIDYITIYSVSPDKPNTEFFMNLCSFCHQSVSVQSRAEDFHKLENWIMELPGFNTEEYHASKATVGEHAKLIWMRQPVVNAQILNKTVNSSLMQELNRGVFLENKDRWLDWGTFGTLQHLATKKWFAIKKTQFPNPSVRGYTYIIKKPTILNGLQLDVLQTETPFWWVGRKFDPDWPVTSYWTNVSFGYGGRDDFERLEKHFIQQIGEPMNDVDSSIQENQKLWASWTVDRVTIKISTWKPYQMDVFQHFCRLEIINEANLDYLFTDSYTQELALHNQLRYLVLEGNLTVASDYTQYPQSRYTPNCVAELLQGENQFVVWVDTKHEKLGIGNKRFAQVLDLTEVAGLDLIGSYWRDSPTELQFHVLPKHQKDMDILSSNYLGKLETPHGDSYWPDIREQLESFLEVPCVFSEDRQYY